MINALHGLMGSLVTRIKYILVTNAAIDYGAISNSASNNITNNISIFLRIKFTATSNLVVLEKGGSNNHFHIQTNPGGTIFFGTTTNPVDRIATGVINDGNWHTVMFYFQSGEIGRYYDTQTIDFKAGVAAPTSNTSDWHFGARAGNFGYGGQMECLIYNRVLSQSEYNILRNGKIISNGLVQTMQDATLFNGASLTIE